MINKQSHSIKVKVRKVTPQKTKHQITNGENSLPDKITLSAELLKGIISMVFLALAILCVISNISIIFSSILKYSGIVTRTLIIINAILVISQITISVIYTFKFKNRALLRTLLFLIGTSLPVFGGCILVISLNLFSKSFVNILTCFSIINFTSVLSCLFISIYNEILNENDKNYIVGYFSALTSFAALIVALVALLK